MKTIKSLIFVSSATALLAFSGCSKEEEIMEVEQISALKSVDIGSLDSGVNGVTLFAGQSIEAGTVAFYDIDTDGSGEVDALEVVYTTTDGWELDEVHFWIGNSLADMPQSRSGNPKIGNFPYNFSNLDGETTYSIVIPFSEIGFSCPGPDDFYVAAHASVRKPDGSGGFQTETGWGDGKRLVQRGNWAMYFSIWITCDGTEPPPVEYESETAFAYGDTYANCFGEYPDFLDNPNRWGWTNGPLSSGTYTFEIYAGAGLCDLSKGTMVGYLDINYDGTSATVSYSLDSPYKLGEVHLYVGNDLFATDKQGEFTLAPGQYPLQETFNNLTTTSHSFNSISVTGEIYVVAHAVVYIPVD